MSSKLLTLNIRESLNKIQTFPFKKMHFDLASMCVGVATGSSDLLRTEGSEGTSLTYWAIPNNYPDSKVHGANMGPSWGRQDPGGPHVGLMNFAIWVYINQRTLPQIINNKRNMSKFVESSADGQAPLCSKTCAGTQGSFCVCPQPMRENVTM